MQAHFKTDFHCLCDYFEILQYCEHMTDIIKEKKKITSN